MNDGLTKFVHLQSKAKVSSEKNELSLKEFLTTVEECRDLHLEFFFFAVGRNFFIIWVNIIEGQIFLCLRNNLHFF